MLSENKLNEILKEALDLSESSIKAVQEEREQAKIKLEKVAASDSSIEAVIKALDEAELLSGPEAKEKLASAFKQHPDQILESLKVVAGHYTDLKNSRPKAHVEGRVIEKSASNDVTLSSWEQDGWFDVIQEGA